MILFSRKFTFLIASSVSLAGCHGWFDNHMANLRHVEVSPVGGGSAMLEAAFAVDEGRQYLDKGQIGLAIHAFQRALNMGGSPAPALNGLGVAYARLGQAETARHLFTEAVVIDPANTLYVANLDRATRQVELALHDTGHDTGHDSADGAPSGARGAASSLADRRLSMARDETRDTWLTRVSAHEFHLRTWSPQNAPVFAVNTAKYAVKVGRAQDVDTAAPDTEAKPDSKTVMNPHVHLDVHLAAALESRFRPVVRMDISGERNGGGRMIVMSGRGEH